MAKRTKQLHFNRALFIFLACFTGIIGIVHHFLFSIPDYIQWVFFSVVIIITGIPHGALDHEVAKQSSNLNNQVFSAKKFHAKYLFSMLLYGIVWYVFPTVSFYLFLKKDRKIPLEIHTIQFHTTAL